MGLDRNTEEMYRKEVPKFVVTDATGTYTYSLTPRDTVVFVDSTLGIGTIYMQNPGVMVGKHVSIMLKIHVSTITIAEKTDETYDWQGDVSLDAAKDGVLYYSDGFKWWEIADNYT